MICTEGPCSLPLSTSYFLNPPIPQPNPPGQGGYIFLSNSLIGGALGLCGAERKTCSQNSGPKLNHSSSACFTNNKLI